MKTAISKILSSVLFLIAACASAQSFQIVDNHTTFNNGVDSTDVRLIVNDTGGSLSGSLVISDNNGIVAPFIYTVTGWNQDTTQGLYLIPDDPEAQIPGGIQVNGPQISDLVLGAAVGLDMAQAQITADMEMGYLSASELNPLEQMQVEAMDDYEFFDLVCRIDEDQLIDMLLTDLDLTQDQWDLLWFAYAMGNWHT